jgi:hypothetical protein
MKYKIGDMLKFTPNPSWKTSDLYCIVCGKGAKNEVFVWWLTSADGKSFMQSVDVSTSVYGVFRKVS